MRGYSVIESAFITRLLTAFPDELNTARCQAGELDAIFDAIFSEGAEYGCLVEFDGGREQDRRPFNNQVFTWKMDCVFVIRYSEDIENKMRRIVDKLATLCFDDHTLGGTTPLAYMVEIGTAEPAKVNDTPFYWLPFVVEAIDR